MQRANQDQLAQQTNVGVLAIRQSELTYYLNLNTAFATQAALIGGFTYGVYTQNPQNTSYNYTTIMMDVYWILAVITVLFAIHVILVTMAIQVFGPGLAINGPVGSMTKATEGMKIEQKMVLRSFVLMMIFFALNSVFTFWMVYDPNAATASTIVFAIAARYWYVYVERIYLRFYWNEDEAHKWREGEEDDDERAPGSFQQPAPRRTSSGSSEGKKGSRWLKNNVRFPRIFRRKSGESRSTGGEELKQDNSNSFEMKPTSTPKPQPAGVLGANYNALMEGYLTKKGSYLNESPTAMTSSEPWERRYFILNSQAELLFYKNRQDFRNQPKKPQSFRPLDLSEFKIEVVNSENPEESTGGGGSRLSSSTTTSSVTGGSGAGGGPVFQLTLIPRQEEVGEDEKDGRKKKKSRHILLLRCDTEEELHSWIRQIRAISPASFDY